MAQPGACSNHVVVNPPPRQFATLKHPNIQWSLNRHMGLRKLAPLKRQRQHPSADRQARHSIWKFDIAIQIFLFWAHPSAAVTGAAVAPNG
jgi:hypothetical protein